MLPGLSSRLSSVVLSELSSWDISGYPSLASSLPKVVLSADRRQLFLMSMPLRCFAPIALSLRFFSSLDGGLTSSLPKVVLLLTGEFCGPLSGILWKYSFVDLKLEFSSSRLSRLSSSLSRVSGVEGTRPSVCL